MTKVIAIDGNEANVAKRVGSNVYAFELLQAMAQYWSKRSFLKIVVFLSAPPLADLPPESERWQYVVVPHQPFWNMWRLPLALRAWRGQIDLFFSPGHYLPTWVPAPKVATIMDLAFEFYPQYFKLKDRLQLQLLTRQSVRQAKLLFAISKQTKADIIEQYQPAAPIEIAYPGFSKPSLLKVDLAREICQQLDVADEFLLFVGTLQPRKNVVRLIRAFEKITAQGYTGQLVLAGKVGWKAEQIMTALNTSVAKDQINYLGFVNKQQKQALLQRAQLLILPGIYEGFGIPPLEAVSLGTLPVVADVASLPEVIPDQSLRFDPWSEAEMVEVIQASLQLTVVQKKAKLRELNQHCQQFEWSKTAQVVCQQLESLLK